MIYVIMKEVTITDESIGTPLAATHDKEKADQKAEELNRKEGFIYYYVVPVMEAATMKPKNRPYQALDSDGLPIITVWAQNAYLARGEALEQLRSDYRHVWRKGHHCLQTDTGIKLYWCHNMGKYVTISNGGDDA